MKDLVEMIGKRGGFNTIDIWNQYEAISNNISKIAKAELQAPTDVIILTAIKYSLSLQLQMKYGNIINYIQETY